MASYFGKYADYLSVVGGVSVCYLTLIVGRQLWQVVRQAIWRMSPVVDLKQYGRWAVVTGCTDGIGKCYALQLAEKGMDIVLISRNPQKLSAVAEEIVQQYRVSVKVITADFKKADIYDDIKQQLSGLDIGILVNNVGMVNRRFPGYFCEADDFEQFNKDLVNVNVLSCVMMTGIVLPDMLERKRGTIINISSRTGTYPVPFVALYSASKAFICFFSKALNLEYSPHGVTIQLLTPGMIESNITRTLAKAVGIQPGLFYPTAQHYVRGALKTIGRESCTTGYWPHSLQEYLHHRLPYSILRQVILKQRNKMAEFLKAE